MKEGAEPIQNGRHSKYMSPQCPQSRARVHRGRGSTPQSGQSLSLGSEFLPSSTRSCPCIFRTLWPLLASALTRTLPSVNAVGPEVRAGWGQGSAQERSSNAGVFTPLLEVKKLIDKGEPGIHQVITHLSTGSPVFALKP